MRSKRKIALVAALAVAGALSAVGIALASGSSTVTLKFTPSNLPTSTFQNGGLNVHTHTNYSDVNANPDRAQLNFDNDIKVNTSATPKCTTTGTTMAQAMAAVRSSLIGKGTARRRPARSTSTAASWRSTAGPGRQPDRPAVHPRQRAPPFTISCSTPSSNPQGNTNVLLDGQLKPTHRLGGTDFTNGKQLPFTTSPRSALPLTDFNVGVGREATQARCHDSNHQLNLKTKFTYSQEPRRSTGPRGLLVGSLESPGSQSRQDRERGGICRPSRVLGLPCLARSRTTPDPPHAGRTARRHPLNRRAMVRVPLRFRSLIRGYGPQGHRGGRDAAPVQGGLEI